jgi:hypothetical protein
LGREKHKNSKRLSSGMATDLKTNFSRRRRHQFEKKALLRQFGNEIAFVVAIWKFSVAEIIALELLFVLSTPGRPLCSICYSGEENRHYPAISFSNAQKFFGDGFWEISRNQSGKKLCSKLF